MNRSTTSHFYLLENFLIEKNRISLKAVDDVWEDFLLEFNQGTLTHDQILIIDNDLFLRGPNLDLLQLADIDSIVN